MKRFLTFILFLLAMIMLSSCVSTPTHEQMVQTMKDYHSKRIDLNSIKDQTKFQKDFNDCADFAIRWYENALIERNEYVFSLIDYLLGQPGAWVKRGKFTDEPGLIGVNIGESPSQKNADNVFRRCMINKGYEMFW